MINIKSSSRYKIPRNKIKEFIGSYLVNKGYSFNFDINIIFIGKNKMKKIAQTYKKENLPLPVLSFFYNEKMNGNYLLGEIFICYPQAILLAVHRNKKVDDIILELIKHGVDNLIKNF